MENNKTRIDISSVDVSKLPSKNRMTELRKKWYKFSLNKLSVVGLAIIILVVLCAIFYKFIVPYPEDVGAVVKFSEAWKRRQQTTYWEPMLQDEICSAV